jgi:hypothetical protein
MVPVVIRLRQILGGITIAGGTALFVGGASALQEAGVMVLRASPFLLMAFGIIAIVRTLIPMRAVVGPMLLVLGGMVALAAQLGIALDRGWYQDVVAVGLVVIGFLILLIPRRAPLGLRTGVVSVNAVFLPARLTPVEAPRTIVGRAILGHLTIDLTSADKPDHQIEVALTAFLGDIVLSIPHGWSVEQGRTGASYASSYRGRLEPRTQPTQTRDDTLGSGTDPEAIETVSDVQLNILSVGSAVALRRG